MVSMVSPYESNLVMLQCCEQKSYILNIFCLYSITSSHLFCAFDNYACTYLIVIKLIGGTKVFIIFFNIVEVIFVINT